MNRRYEWILLGSILAVGGWLRFSHLDLLQFQSDEAIASHLAWQCAKGGALPTEGLTSSVGVANPPLFIYLLIPMYAVTTNPAVVSCFIAVLGLGAVAATWWIGRKYYGPITGLVAAAMFAVSPWAVIYSRQIWAQDFLPVFSTAIMWVVHVLVVGKKPKAIFWVALLTLCAIQIHFAGLALTATVVVILLWLRPKMDWRFAVAGIVAGIVPLIPYLGMQSRNGWQDFRKAATQIGGQKWEIPEGVTIQPNSGYPLPRPPSESWIHALAIMNAGEIEDVLGLSSEAKFDQKHIWEGKGREYFDATNWLLLAQRVTFVAALVWLVIRRMPVAAWVVVPVLVFMAVGLLTYLSYYVILWPAQFLICGVVVERLAGKIGLRLGRMLLAGAVLVMLAGNVTFMQKFYRFVGKYGGAQGTYGTGLGYKRAAANCLTERGDAKQLMESGRLLRMDELGREETAQVELPWLAMVMREGRGAEAAPTLSTNAVVLVVDENRTNYDPQRAPALVNAPQTNFGPIRLYFMTR